AKGELFIVSTPRRSGPTNEQSARTEHGARLGLVIGKRMAPLSVTRNTIKRVIREAFRQRRAELPPRDYVFRLYRRGEPTPLRQLKRQVRQEVDTLLTKASR